MSTLDEVMNSKDVAQWTDRDVDLLIAYFRENRDKKPKKETGPTDDHISYTEIRDAMPSRPQAKPTVISFPRRRLVQL